MKPFNIEQARTGHPVEVFDVFKQVWKLETAWFHTAYVFKEQVVYGEDKLVIHISRLRMKEE